MQQKEEAFLQAILTKMKFDSFKQLIWIKSFFASHVGWWTAQPPQSNSFFPPGGFQSLLQNGLTSSPAPSGSKRKTIINIDEGEEVRTEKRLAWIPADDKRLVSGLEL